MDGLRPLTGNLVSAESGTQFQLAELVKQFLGDNGNPLLLVSQLPRLALGYLWRKGPKMQHAKAVM